jgi:hypothetical protein
MITAQALYDEREEFARISGTDLHDVFRFLLDGEPSPAGDMPISRAKLFNLWDRTNADTQAFIDGVLSRVAESKQR